MSLAKRTGRVQTYEQWCSPQPVENALDLLESELARYRGRVDSVHLSFTTDPFMWNAVAEAPNTEMSKLTTSIIKRLNAEDIRVTVLTKGTYPDEFIEQAQTLHPDNQYGVSIVSLAEEFRMQWEPGSAPISARLESLRRLSQAGTTTWVSMEPYPTPNVDPSATDPAALLEAVKFVDKAVFGRWNYNKLVNSYEDGDAHYAKVAGTVSDWAEKQEVVLHIKRGTPLSVEHEADVLAIR
jgi:DNA repair photolyase